MADSPEIKIQTQKVEASKTEALDTSSGLKRDKRTKRTKEQRKRGISKRSLLRKIFSSKKEFDPEKDNILNKIIDGIADKIEDAVDSALETKQAENPLQELEELHPPKRPDLKELAEELSKEEVSDGNEDDKKDTVEEIDEEKATSSTKNKIRL